MTNLPGTAPRILAAPMEGLTDGVWRRTHHAFFGGADWYFTPFQRLTYTQHLTVRERRDLDPGTNSGVPVVPQALTREPAQLLWYLRLAKGLGYPNADLNLGCPSPTVTKRGRGSALLKEPERLRLLLDAACKADILPLSVKTRIGFSSPDEWDGLVRLFKDYPLLRVTVHLRTAAEGYTGPVHPEAYEKALLLLGERAVYNGDVRTAEDARAFSARFGPGHGLMIGRGLFAQPALARMIRGGSAASAEEWHGFLLALLDAWTELYGLTVALGRVKKMMVYPLAEPEDVRLFRPFRKADSREAFLSALDGFCAAVKAGSV